MHLHGLWTFALPLGLLSSLTAPVSARLRDGRLHGNMMRTAAVPVVSAPSPDIPVVSRNGTVLPPYTTVYEFDQLIDHNNPSRGTFKQRFWHTWEFYLSGTLRLLMVFRVACALSVHATRRVLSELIRVFFIEGGPIILMTPGETSADGMRRRSHPHTREFNTEFIGQAIRAT